MDTSIPKVMKKKNKKYLLIGFVIIVIIGIIFYNSNQNLFAVVNNAVSTTVLSSNPNLKIGDCWNERTVTNVVYLNKKYTVSWTQGCDCTLWKNNKGQINLYFYSDVMNYNTLKSYSSTFISLVKGVIPFNNYNFNAYYLKYPTSTCGIKINDPLNLIVKITDKTSFDAGGTGMPGEIEIGSKYKNNKIVIIHEIGHNFLLNHVCADYTRTYITGNAICYKEFYNNFMLPIPQGSSGNFLQWQQDIIKGQIDKKCIKYTNKLCCPSQGKSILVPSEDYVSPIPKNC